MAGREDDAAHCLYLADHTGDRRGGHDAVLTDDKMADLQKRAQIHQGINTHTHTVSPETQMHSSQSPAEGCWKTGISLAPPVPLRNSCNPQLPAGARALQRYATPRQSRGTAPMTARLHASKARKRKPSCNPPLVFHRTGGLVGRRNTGHLATSASLRGRRRLPMEL